MIPVPVFREALPIPPRPSEMDRAQLAYELAQTHEEFITASRNLRELSQEYNDAVNRIREYNADVRADYIGQERRYALQVQHEIDHPWETTVKQAFENAELVKRNTRECFMRMQTSCLGGLRHLNVHCLHSRIFIGAQVSRAYIAARANALRLTICAFLTFAAAYWAAIIRRQSYEV
jgi:hypothetical protein